MFANGVIRWTAPPALLALGFAIGAVALAIPVFSIATLILGPLALLFLAFFRDPDLEIGAGIVSPAAGKITKVENGADRGFVSIFMNVNDIHVNRAPLAGTVTAVEYHPGAFHLAFDKESDKNERLNITLETLLGTVTVILIAGWVARRIEPYVTVGDHVEKGERIGMIKLGSRVDTIFPPHTVTIGVSEGDRITVGRDTIATPVTIAEEHL